MTDIHAIATQARLAIHIPWPRELAEAHKREWLEVVAALSDFPRYAASVIRLAETPEGTAFLESLDFGPVRDEFRRKAKKMGFDLGGSDFPVNIETDDRGVELHVWCRR